MRELQSLRNQGTGSVVLQQAVISLGTGVVTKHALPALWALGASLVVERLFNRTCQKFEMLFSVLLVMTINLVVAVIIGVTSSLGLGLEYLLATLGLETIIGCTLLTLAYDTNIINRKPQ